jgi:4-hydroxyacetophenone monooxygenase
MMNIALTPGKHDHPGMSTYYCNRHGRVFSAMPWRFVDYWAMIHDPDFSRYRMTPA